MRVEMYKRRRGVLRSGWASREFELDSGWLVKTRRPHSRMNLSKATMLTPGQRLHGSPTDHLIILTQGRKRWELAARSAEDFMIWTAAIRKVIPAREVDKSDDLVASKKKTASTKAASLDESFSSDGIDRGNATTTVPVAKRRDEKIWLVPVAVLGGWFVSVWVSLCASVFLAYKIHASSKKERRRGHLEEENMKEESKEDGKKETSGESLRVRKGIGLREVPPTLAPPPMTWSRAPASDFRLRQKGYLTTREKGPSAEAYYRVVYVQVFDTDSRVENVTDFVDIPEPTVQRHQEDDFPSLIVVDAQLPSEVGPLRSRENADGPGHQIVVVMEATGIPVPALFKQFCRGEKPGRFKVVAQVRNVEKVPKLARRYNGKPALIDKTGKVRTGKTKDGRSFLEMAVNVHAFGYLARYGFHSLYDRFGELVVSAGFTIEGRDEESGELPENIIAAFDLNYLS